MLVNSESKTNGNSINVFRNCFDTRPIGSQPIWETFKSLRTDWTEQIEDLRRVLTEEGKAQYDEAKRKLPAFTPCGTFTSRSKSSLVEHNGVVHHDVDGLTEPTARSMKARLVCDPHIAYCFFSPSFGLKLGFLIEPVTSDEQYKVAWQATADYLLVTHGVPVDPSGKDISRLCYFSSDPELFENRSATLFPVDYTVTAQTVPVRVPSPVNAGDERGNRVVQTVANMLDQSRPGNRHDTRLRAGCLLGGAIAAGWLDEETAWEAISDAVQRNTDTPDKAYREIASSIEHGKKEPLVDNDVRIQLEAQVAEIIKPPVLASNIGPSLALKEATKNKTASKVRFRKYSQLKEIASTQREDWLIPGWLEFGSLTMLAGLPFSGKSCVVADIIGAIANGSLWCDKPVQQVPIILVNLENRERILVERIDAALQGNEGRIEDLLFDVDISCLELPLTVESIAELILELRNAIGEVGKKCLLVIDTMRSAFTDSNELDQEDMKKLLYPLQRLAQQTETAVLILHHNSRGKDEYAGSAAIAGACDYMWSWHSDYEKCEGKLKMVGTRSALQDALLFVYDKQLRRNVFIGTVGQETLAKRSAKSEAEAAVLLEHFGDGWEFWSEIKERIGKKAAMSESTIQRRLTVAVEVGYLERRGERKNVMIRLSDSGRAVASRVRGETLANNG